MIDLKQMMLVVTLKVFIDLRKRFPDQQFKTEGHQFSPFRKNRNSKGGGGISLFTGGFYSKKNSKIRNEKHANYLHRNHYC